MLAVNGSLYKVYEFDNFFCGRGGCIYQRMNDPDNQLVMLLTTDTSNNQHSPLVKIKGEWYAVDKIIADHFLKQPSVEGDYIINHKDGDYMNCAEWNLEWVPANSRRTNK